MRKKGKANISTEVHTFSQSAQTLCLTVIFPSLVPHICPLFSLLSWDRIGSYPSFKLIELVSTFSLSLKLWVIKSSNSADYIFKCLRKACWHQSKSQTHQVLGRWPPGLPSSNGALRCLPELLFLLCEYLNATLHPGILCICLPSNCPLFSCLQVE